MSKALLLLIAGLILLTVGLVVGVGGTVLGMVRSFGEVAGSSSPSPAQLSQGIGTALINALIGISAAFVGLCLVIAAAVVHFSRKK